MFFQKIPSEIIVFNDGSSSLVGKRLILNIMLKKILLSEWRKTFREEGLEQSAVNVK